MSSHTHTHTHTHTGSHEQSDHRSHEQSHKRSHEQSPNLNVLDNRDLDGLYWGLLWLSKPFPSTIGALCGWPADNTPLNTYTDEHHRLDTYNCVATCCFFFCCCCCCCCCCCAIFPTVTKPSVAVRLIRVPIPLPLPTAVPLPAVMPLPLPAVATGLVSTEPM